MQTTDNGELVRRRGRWQNHRIMEVYIQEVSSLLYLQKLPRPTRDKIIEVAQFFNEVVEKVTVFLEAGIPLNAWCILFQRWQMPWADGKETGIVNEKVDHLVESGKPLHTSLVKLQWRWWWSASPSPSCAKLSHNGWKKRAHSKWYIYIYKVATKASVKLQSVGKCMSAGNLKQKDHWLEQWKNPIYIVV